MEEIIKKIEKLLALAGNNPNENEALAASLKAQELIAKYNVNIDHLGDNKETPKIGTAKHTTGKGYKWRFILAPIIARNFRCKLYLINGIDVVFYGYESDSKAALSTFSFLFKVGNRFAAKYYNQYKKNHMDTQGVRNMYLNGFCSGIANAVDKQCTALMVVVPKEVEESFTEKMKGNKPRTKTLMVSSDRSVYLDGQRDGRNMAESRNLPA